MIYERFIHMDDAHSILQVRPIDPPYFTLVVRVLLVCQMECLLQAKWTLVVTYLPFFLVHQLLNRLVKNAPITVELFLVK